MKLGFSLFALILLVSVTPLLGTNQDGFHMDILVNSNPAPEYFHNGKIYIEAMKGKEYSVRIRNPFNLRVAVALAVDGLNTIDARHTTALEAKKWVLEPYETIIIQGWQVNQKEARRFFFTTEEKSYGKWIGNMQNLGVISAVFYKERIRLEPCPGLSQNIRKSPSKIEAKETEGLPSGTNHSADRSSTTSDEAAAPIQQKDEFAATGIGKRSEHPIQWVSMELEPAPAATLSVRYEFRPVLVKMGILPAPISQDPFNRREQARGFNQQYFCPEPR